MFKVQVVSELIEKSETALRRLPSRASAPWIAEARALMVLAAPLVLTQLAQMAIGTTDLILLGRYSQKALAAVAIGNTVYWFAWLVGGGPASAVSPMIAHILGERAGNKGGVRASLRMGLWAVAIVSLVVMPIMWSARPILLMLHQQPDLAQGAGQFVALVSIGLPFSLSTMVLSGFATALGHPRAGLWVSLATIVFNALAGYTLIFGNFGAPRLGIVGSGMATSASQVFGFVSMVAIIHTTYGAAANAIDIDDGPSHELALNDSTTAWNAAPEEPSSAANACQAAAEATNDDEPGPAYIRPELISGGTS